MRAGGPALSVEVAPSATTTEPAPDAGIEIVVPAKITVPPGVRVSDGPMANTGVSPITLAEITFPPREMVGFSVMAGGAGVMVCVAPSTIIWEPPPDVGTMTVAPLMVVVCPALSVCDPMTIFPGIFG